jgi:hypothetical protein
MNDLRSLLLKGDPIAREGGLSTADAAQMRARLLAAAWEPQMASRHGLAFALAAVLLLATVGSSWYTSSIPSDRSADAPAVGSQQLQFSTPGGTRIIWTFNPDLHVR